MDRKTLLAIALCFGIFFGWQKLYIEPQQKARTAAQQAQQTPAPAPVAPTGQTAESSKAAAPTVQPETKIARPSEKLELVTGTGTATVSDSTKIFTGWQIKGYRQGVKETTPAIDLQSVIHQDGVGELAFDSPELAYLGQVQGKLTGTAQGSQWVYEDANVRLVREVKSQPNQNWADVVFTAEFKTKKPGYAFFSLKGHSPENDPEEADRQLVYYADKSVERTNIKEKVELKEVINPVKWIGVTSRYFLLAAIVQGSVEPKGLMQPIDPSTGRVSLVYPVSADSLTIPLRVFFGPKDLDVLRSVDQTLDNTVDFGWFTVFAYPLLKIMKWFYKIVHNYGVAIILLTLLVNIITYPLNYKSMKSMKEMAKLQPQLQKLKEKYKDDKEALNREMMSMMKTHGYNPMAGCLPILIQMPIFFALYRVLYSSIELYHAPFALWIQDLSMKDPYYVTPVLLSGLMYIQQKMTPNTATDPAQAKMMQFMPLIFGAFMLTLPSGLTVYMLVNSLAGILRMMIMNRQLDGRNVAAARSK